MSEEAKSGRSWRDAALVVGTLVICTFAGYISVKNFHPLNVTLIYLAGVVVVAARCDRWAAVTTAVISTALFDLLFVPPELQFVISDPEYLVSLGVMLLVSLIISSMAEQIKDRTRTITLAQAQVELERTKNTLLSSVSHDLRTPLTSIQGAASSIANNPDMAPSTRQELAASIVLEANRLNRLLTNLLNMTRVDANVIAIDKQWVSLAELVGAVVGQLERATVGQGELKVAGDKIVIDIDDEFPLIFGDEVLLAQVFFNLLDNATRYAEPNSEIRISAKTADKKVLVSVSNTGSKLAPQDETRVFDKFYRGVSGQHRPGTGLGLAICRAIVKAHGGDISAENLGTNSVVVHFWLPQLEGAPQVPQEAGQEHA